MRSPPQARDSAPFVSSYCEDSHRSAVFEDDGVVAFFYLTAPDSMEIVGDVWVYNRVAAPPPERVAERRPGPPPASTDVVGPDARCTSPARHAWRVKWSATGHAAALYEDDRPVAFLTADDRRGWSRRLQKRCAWGSPWSDPDFSKLFGSE